MANVVCEIDPVHQTRDVSAAIDCYVGRLGFKMTFRDSAGDTRHAGVRRDAIELHRQWHDETSFRPSAGFGRGDALMLPIRVVDPGALFAESCSKGVFDERTALRDTPWATQELAFYDLNGRGMTFFRAM